MTLGKCLYLSGRLYAHLLNGYNPYFTSHGGSLTNEIMDMEMLCDHNKLYFQVIHYYWGKKYKDVW